MFGFFIGTACLIGLVVTLSRHHEHRRGFGTGRGRFGRYGFALGRAFDRLETSGGQEREIREALDELWEEARLARRDFRDSGEDVARLIREPELPAGAFDALFAQQDQVLGRVRAAGVRAFERIHGALDARQRDVLASWVESRRFGFFGAPRGC